MPPIKTRFAPSPTGLIHLGNARTALLSALGGDTFVLRIEDTDGERCRREFVDELIADLHWLGLEWQEGPQSAEPDPHWFQSQRGSIYKDYYRALEEKGLAYPCFCTPVELEVSRKVQLSAGRPPRYSGKCAHLSVDEIRRKRDQGLSPTLRFRVPKNQAVEFEDEVRGPQRFASDDIGDFIIRRADGTPAFFFCNAIDDALMGITRVLRGEDHLANTPRQLMILAALDLPRPRYAHISLIVGDDGAPLSKRNGSRSINQLREEGYFPEAVVNMLARLGHPYDSESLLGVAELRAGFDVNRLGRSPARFDVSHLDHWQGLAVRRAADDTLWTWLHAETRAVVPEAHRADFLDIVRSNCLFPRQADAWAKVLFTDELELEADIAAVAQSAGEAFYLAAIDAATESPDDFAAFLAGLKRRSGAKGKHLFLPLRAALTGSLDGPELAKIYQLMDKPRLHRRLAEFTYESE
ncbi:glutamate--tRNA ligase [Methylococcus geothermalis]|nr:glutamate--tRNA ligase [Methylococcus geothermalis]